MHRWRVLLALLLWAAQPCSGQPAPTLATWSDGPRGLLLTAEERSVLAGLTSARQVAEYSALIWARRDPDPLTPDNEFMVDLEARIAAADRQFGEDGTRGAMTDRGRVLLLLGRPSGVRRGTIVDELERLYRDSPSGGSAPSLKGIGSESTRTGKGVIVTDLTRDVAADAMFMEGNSPVGDTVRHGVRFSLVSGRAEVWLYRTEDLPPGVASEPVSFTYFDHFGSGRWRLETDLPGARSGAVLLAVAPNLKVLHPDLERIPDRPLISASSGAAPEELAWLDREQRPAGGATVLAVRGARSPTNLPAWIVLRVASDLPRADRVVGRLLAEDGTAFGSFRLAVEGEPTPLGSLYEIELPLPRAAVLMELALLAGGTPLTVEELALEAAPPGPGSPYLTAVVAGPQPIEIGPAAAHMPFVFGGYHLHPRPQGRLLPGETLCFFCLLVDPEASPVRPPPTSVTLRLIRDRDQAEVLRSDRRQVPSSAVAPGVFMIGSEVPLDAHGLDGPHHLEVEVTDELTGCTRTTRIPIVPSVSAPSS